MDALHLSDRMAAVAAYVPDDARVADIGSDHAYLPANLILNKRIQFAIAGEVAKGPLENAEHEINKHRLNEQLIPRLADGLAAIQPEDEIDTVVIAGMGGRLITQILEAGHQGDTQYDTIIVQPNLDVDVVRKWFMQHQYAISDARMLFDDGHYYEVVVAQPGSAHYTETELQFGPINIQANGPIWRERWSRELARQRGIMEKLVAADQTQSEAYTNYQQTSQQIEEVLADASK